MINLKHELNSVLNIDNIRYYKNKPTNAKYSTGWFKITDNTKICQVLGGFSHGDYLCIEIKYPNKDELKFKLFNNSITLESRIGFINIFKFNKVQHCRFTPDLNYDMYQQYMFIEDHWTLDYEDYSVLNEIFHKCKDYLSEEPQK